MGFRRALSLAYLILSVSYFLLGSIGSPWLAPVRNAVPLVVLVAFILMLAGTGYCAGEARGRWYYGARIQGKRALDWLLHLLHAGERWRRAWAVRRFVGASASQRGERFPRGGLSVFADVLRRAAAFQRTEEGRTKYRPTSLAPGGQELSGRFLSNPRFMLFLLIFSGYWIVLLAGIHHSCRSTSTTT